MTLIKCLLSDTTCVVSKSVLVLSLVVASFAAIGSPRAAAAIPPIDGYQVISGIESGVITRQNITAQQQAALLDVIAPADVTVLETRTTTDAPAETATGGACWSTWQRWGQRSSHGNTLYTWWQGLRWCARAGQITSSTVFDRGGETSTPGWSFTGHGGQGSWNLGWEVRQYTQEKFTFGIGWFSYTSTKCGQIRGGASGLFSRRESCGLNP